MYVVCTWHALLRAQERFGYTSPADARKFLVDLVQAANVQPTVAEETEIEIRSDEAIAIVVRRGNKLTVKTVLNNNGSSRQPDQFLLNDACWPLVGEREELAQ